MIVFFFRLHIPLTHPRTDGTAPRRHRDGRRFEKIYLCKYEECIYLNPNPPFPAPESVISLPPLDCLRFFEAAARLRSFAHAGDELGVTPPAVAHRIRMLESHLGAELFERGAEACASTAGEGPITRRGSGASCSTCRMSAAAMPRGRSSEASPKSLTIAKPSPR